MRLMVARVFGLLALLGLAVWLSSWGMLTAISIAGFDPSDDVFWAWVIVGALGLMAALPFGALAVIASRPAGPTAATARHIGLGLLGVLCLVAGLWRLVGGGFDLVPVVVSVLLLAVGSAALLRLRRGKRRERARE